MQAMILLFSDARGTYIPQHFAEDAELVASFGFTDDDKDIAILREGQDHDWYWDAWDSVLQRAKSAKGYTLHQDGDLWAILPDAMSNEEYENFFGEMKPTPEGWCEYTACRDCLLYIANGDVPEDSPDCAAGSQWTPDGADALYCPVADAAEYGFCTDPCELCGALAGDRYRVLSKPEPTPVGGDKPSALSVFI